MQQDLLKFELLARLHDALRFSVCLRLDTYLIQSNESLNPFGLDSLDSYILSASSLFIYFSFFSISDELSSYVIHVDYVGTTGSTSRNLGEGFVLKERILGHNKGPIHVRKSRF